MAGPFPTQLFAQVSHTVPAAGENIPSALGVNAQNATKLGVYATVGGFTGTPTNIMFQVQVLGADGVWYNVGSPLTLTAAGSGSSLNIQGPFTGQVRVNAAFTGGTTPTATGTTVQLQAETTQ